MLPKNKIDEYIFDLKTLVHVSSKYIKIKTGIIKTKGPCK